MDRSALAKDLLKWEQLRRQLDELEQAIKDAVLQLGETVTAGNVRATYSSGRKSYNYEAAAKDVPEGVITSHTTVKTSIDWRGICKAMKIEDVPFTQSEPSVSLKLEA